LSLGSLTTLPENVKFENQGNVNLGSLTTLPENVKFENQGNVYLGSLNGQTIKYRGKNISIRVIDGYTMIITNSKSKDDFIIHKAKYFKGGNLKDFPSCFIAERDGYFAHGETLEQAISDCNFKSLQGSADVEDIINDIRKKQTVNIEEYRLITGACSFGVAQFMKDKNITATEMPLSKVIEITNGYYGGSKIKELFSDCLN